MDRSPAGSASCFLSCLLSCPVPMISWLETTTGRTCYIIQSSLLNFLREGNTNIELEMLWPRLAIIQAGKTCPPASEPSRRPGMQVFPSESRLMEREVRKKNIRQAARASTAATAGKRQTGPGQVVAHRRLHRSQVASREIPPAGRGEH